MAYQQPASFSKLLLHVSVCINNLECRDLLFLFSYLGLCSLDTLIAETCLQRHEQWSMKASALNCFLLSYQGLVIFHIL